MLETVDLGHVQSNLAANLSGGQRARVSLATALLGDPDLLVLDEPTVGLDPVLRRALWHTFTELARNGTTLLVSSHVMDEAARCDDLLLMRDGDLLASGCPGRSPRTDRRARPRGSVPATGRGGGGMSIRATASPPSGWAAVAQ